DRIVRPIREGDGNRVRSSAVRLASPFTIERQRKKNIALGLLGIVEKPLHARPIGPLPERIGQLEYVGSLALLLQPVGVIEAIALVGQRLHEEPEPVAIRSRLEVSREKC